MSGFLEVLPVDVQPVGSPALASAAEGLAKNDAFACSLIFSDFPFVILAVIHILKLHL